MLIAMTLPPVASKLGRALERWGYFITREGTQRFADLYLESGDGRLQKAGFRARIRRSVAAGHQLQLLEIGGTILHQTELDGWVDPKPNRPSPVVELSGGHPAEDIPNGLIGARRLLAFLRISTSRRAFTITTPSGAEILATTESFRSDSPLREGEHISGTLITLDTTESQGASAHLIVFLRDRLNLQFEEFDHFSFAAEKLGLHLPGNRAEAGLLVKPTDPVGLVGRKIVGQQLLRIRWNMAGTLGGWDTEFLHDLRVAVRRTRSALRVFSHALGPARAQALRNDLRGAVTTLGVLRDLDVFTENLHALQGEPYRHSAAYDELLRMLSNQRAEGGSQLEKALTQKGFQRILSRLDTLSGSPCPKTVRAAYTPLDLEAPGIVSESHLRVLKAGRKLGANPSPEELHRMRILFKRLRYSCEFMSQAFPGALADLIKTCVKVQDCLGEHQDAVVAAGWLAEFAAKLHKEGRIDVSGVLDLGGLIQMERAKAAQRRKDFSVLWKDFLIHYGRGRTEKLFI